MESGFSPGYILAHKYRLVACIGVGGMGEVWRALHLTLNAHVAIKFIHTHLNAATDASGRFMREAQAAAALRSPHVVQILDYGVDGTLAYMVMELLEGESLAARLQRPLVQPAELARIMTHVARALSKAHEAGIVHRDLKPDNIFLTNAHDELIAKVLDFGIAKFKTGVAVDASTRTGAVLGTPYYMSPEQAEGNRHVDHRTDIWAMGVIAFECLTGQRPFDSEAFGHLLLKICTHPIPVPSQVAPVPHGFDEWFATAVNRDASQRFASAKEAAEALTRVCSAPQRPFTGSSSNAIASAFAASTAAPVLASTNQSLARTVEPSPRRSLLLPLLVVGVVGAVTVGGGLVYYAHSRGLLSAAAATDSVAAGPLPPPPAASSQLPPPARTSSAAGSKAEEPNGAPAASTNLAEKAARSTATEKPPPIPSPKRTPPPVSKPRPKASPSKPTPGVASPEDLL
jgi:serine/threonine protein kinase